jgi:hypothetical protein
MRPTLIRLGWTILAGALVATVPAVVAAQDTKPADHGTHAGQPRQKAASHCTMARDLSALPESAASAGDHQTLARHYTALAARLDDDAARHEALAKSLRAAPNPSETKRPGTPDTAAHCERLVSMLKQAAGEARELAAAHEQMTTAAK